MWLHRTLVLGVVVLLGLAFLGQTPDPLDGFRVRSPDEGAVSLALSAEQIPPGFYLAESKVRHVVSQDPISGEPESTYPALYRRYENTNSPYSSDSPATIETVTGLFETRLAAARALRGFLSSRQRAMGSKIDFERVGDVTVRDPGAIAFSYDRAMAFVSVTLPDGAPEASVALQDAVVVKLVERIQEMGLQPTATLDQSLHWEVLSGEVDRVQGKVFRARGSHSLIQEMRPLSVEWEVYNGETEVFRGQTVSTLSDEFFVEWNGGDSNNSPLPDGTYRLMVTVRDAFGQVVSTDFAVPSRSTVSTAISLQLQVLSKHVKPKKQEWARVKATATGGTIVFSYTIYRGGVGNQPNGTLVFQSPEVSAAGGVAELVWNGTDQAGQPASNGSYVMMVLARGALGGQASQQAHVVVNQ